MLPQEVYANMLGIMYRISLQADNRYSIPLYGEFLLTVAFKNILRLPLATVTCGGNLSPDSEMIQ